MAQQTINIGTTANDGTGDPNRTAFDKTNDNFDELYEALSSGVFAYISTPAVTTVVTPGTYVPIAGTFTNDIISGFSVDAVPSIVYDGTTPTYFEIDWHGTLSTDGASETVTAGIAVNGTIVTPSTMDTLCKTAGEKYSFSGTVVVGLEEDDYVQLVCTSDSACDVTFSKFTTTIKPFILGYNPA